MLLLLAIFIVILLLFFILVRAINGVFLIARRIKSPTLSIAFIISFLLVILIGSGIATLSTSYLIVSSNTDLYAAVPQNSLVTNLQARDCRSLLNTIYLEEEKIYKPTNHRYIEEVIPTPARGEEYQKGAVTLRESAEQYELLDIDRESKVYSDRIADKLREQAELFEARKTLNEDNDGIKPIFQILTEMDRVTSERKAIVKDIKQKCAKSQLSDV